MQRVLLEREAEIALAMSANWKNISLTGTFCCDILVFLGRKCATPKKLAIAVDLPIVAINGYILALRAAKLVKLCKLRRKPGTAAKLIVAITDEGKILAEQLSENI